MISSISFLLFIKKINSSQSIEKHTILVRLEGRENVGKNNAVKMGPSTRWELHTMNCTLVQYIFIYYTDFIIRYQKRPFIDRLQHGKDLGHAMNAIK